MLDKVRHWINNRFDDDTVSGNAEARVRQAVCALLLEIAHSDDRFTTKERERIVELLTSHYGISKEDAADLIAASRKALKESTDLWQFAQLINEQCTIEEKNEIIEALWRVVYVDGKLDEHEDYLIHKLSTLLRLEHKQLIDAKLKVLAEMR
jgi:uncharacterized tellurite resistance protein B-like protein